MKDNGRQKTHRQVSLSKAHASKFNNTFYLECTMH